MNRGARSPAALARDASTLAASAAGYYVCAVIGTLLSVPPSGFAIIWPATAFLISVLLIVPKRQWWLCAAGVVPTHFIVAATLQPHAPLAVVLTQVGGNLLLAFSTAVALRAALGKRKLFDSLSAVITFMLVAGIGVPAIVNALILSVHVATGWVHDFRLSWVQWMIAGVFPTITIPPVLVLASNRRLTGQPTASRYPIQELAALSALLFAVSFEVFGPSFGSAYWPALLLAPLPLLLWAAVRLGVGGTGLSLLVMATAIVAQALRQTGPFADQSPIEEIISLQAFLIATTVPLMLLAALMDERRRTANELHQSEARMTVAASATDTGLWQWDAATLELWLTDHCRAMFDLGDDPDLTPFSFLDAVHTDDRARLEAAIRTSLTSAEPARDDEYRTARGGETQWLVLHTRSEFDKAGRVRVSGVFRDVTDAVLMRQETGKLRRRLVRLKQDERRRIAEELHDSTTQHLVAARLNLSLLKSKVRADTTRHLLSEANRSLQEASMEIRTISYLLHPPDLGKFGLSGVLQQYVPGFESRTGLFTSLRVSPLVDLLPSDQQQAILRITQESLGNIHRHARAKHVSISVRCISGTLHLLVRDDGRGIAQRDARDLTERLNLGVGIPGMTARVRQLNGRISINSGTGGTTVHVAIPLGVSLH